MGVGFFLAGLVHAGAGVLDEGASVRCKVAARVDGINSNVAAAIIGDEDMFTGFIDDNVARMSAAGRGIVDLGEFSWIGSIDLKAGDGAVLLASVVVQFINGVKDLAIWMDREEGRTGSLGRETDLSERAGGGIEFVGVDAFARTAGVSSNINRQFFWCSCHCIKSDYRQGGQAKNVPESHGTIKQGMWAAGNKEGVGTRKDKGLRMMFSS